ncbi:hypothetical protein Tco_0046678 [Tanacetum coccineum]
MLGREPRCRLLLGSLHQKRRKCGGSSSGAGAARESASKSYDALSIQLSGDPPSIIASKAGEFIPGISTVAPKRLSNQSKKPSTPRKPLSKKGQLVIGPPNSAIGESAVGSFHEAADKLCSSEAGLKQLVSRGSSKTSTSLSSASTRSEPLVSARPGPQSSPVSYYIPGIVFDPVEDSAETPRRDPFYASMSVDPSVAKDNYHPD